MPLVYKDEEWRIYQYRQSQIINNWSFVDGVATNVYHKGHISGWARYHSNNFRCVECGKKLPSILQFAIISHCLL